MSSRDIDSTSENVLHDWARDAAHDAEHDAEHDANAGQDELVVDPDESSDEGAPAWGTASSATESPEEPVAVVETATETETEIVEEEAAPDELEGAPEIEDGEPEIDETPMQVELS